MNDTIKQDAREYGLHLKQGGWRLGLLVARNVVKAPGRVASETLAPKVNATTFAKEAGTTAKRVLLHLAAWEAAAEAGKVPAAASLSPGIDIPLDADKLPEWSEFYTSVTGGYNGGNGRKPTKSEAKSAVEKLPVEEQAALLAEILNTPEVIEALKEDDEAVDHVFDATTKLAGSRGKSKKAKKNRSLEEMTVVLDLIGVLGKIRDLAKEDSDSPLIKECKNLMRETLDILNQIEEADDPDAVAGMFADFEDMLSQQ